MPQGTATRVPQRKIAHLRRGLRNVLPDLSVAIFAECPKCKPDGKVLNEIASSGEGER
jgi:hypothetical protein